MLKRVIYDEIQGIFYDSLVQASTETDIPENVVKASIQYGKAIKCYGISHKFIYADINIPLIYTEHESTPDTMSEDYF